MWKFLVVLLSVLACSTSFLVDEPEDEVLDSYKRARARLTPDQEELLMELLAADDALIAEATGRGIVDDVLQAIAGLGMGTVHVNILGGGNPVQQPQAQAPAFLNPSLSFPVTVTTNQQPAAATAPLYSTAPAYSQAPVCPPVPTCAYAPSAAAPAPQYAPAHAAPAPEYAPSAQAPAAPAPQYAPVPVQAAPAPVYTPQVAQAATPEPTVAPTAAPTLAPTAAPEPAPTAETTAPSASLEKALLSPQNPAQSAIAPQQVSVGSLPAFSQAQPAPAPTGAPIQGFPIYSPPPMAPQQVQQQQQGGNPTTTIGGNNNHLFSTISNVIRNSGTRNVTGIVDQSLRIATPAPIREFVNGILNVVYCNSIRRLLGRC